MYYHSQTHHQVFSDSEDSVEEIKQHDEKGNEHNEQEQEEEENEQYEPDEEFVDQQDQSNAHNSLNDQELHEDDTNKDLVRPKVKQTVKYLVVGCQDWEEAEIISKGGKNSGKYKNWLNVCHEDGTETFIDWKNDVPEWHAVSKNLCESSSCEEV